MNIKQINNEFEVLFPNKDNNGDSLRTKQNQFKSILLDTFGGYSEHQVKGAWKDKGEVYQDELTSYSVSGDSISPKDFESLLTFVIIEGKQKAVFYKYNNKSFIAEDKK